MKADALPPEAKEIPVAALERPASERAPFRSAACVGDEGLSRRVHELLAAHDRAGDLVTLGGVGLDLAPGAHLGPYRLVQELGENGFGVVFRAEQEAPLRRSVALKVLKLGSATRPIALRFEAERQVLARMEHPAIARIYDAGETPTELARCSRCAGRLREAELFLREALGPLQRGAGPGDASTAQMTLPD